MRLGIPSRPLPIPKRPQFSVAQPQQGAFTQIFRWKRSAQPGLVFAREGAGGKGEARGAGGGKRRKPGRQEQEAVGEEVLRLSQPGPAAAVAVLTPGGRRRVLLVPVTHLCRQTGVVPAGCAWQTPAALRGHGAGTRGTRRWPSPSAWGAGFAGAPLGTGDGTTLAFPACLLRLCPLRTGRACGRLAPTGLPATERNFCCRL